MTNNIIASFIYLVVPSSWSSFAIYLPMHQRAFSGTISANNMATTQRVQVFVRTRPTPDFAMDSIAIDDKEISIHAHNQADCKFNVDGVLHNSSQEEVYSSCGESVVTHALNGINGTIFAYGQTGAGKTYTMCGESQYRLRGIIPRAIAQIFKEVWEKDDCSIIVRISCLEIYNETLTDLLLALPDDGNRKSNSSTLAVEGNNKDCCVKGLTVKVAENEEEAMNMFFEAEKNRLVGQHHLNKQSSRSHVIFTIYLEVHSRTNASSEYTVSKLNLIDLAGSERLRKTESSGVLMKEAIYINKSLSFLEQVVIALADRHRTHIPYRHSQLTRVIKDSIGGNCNTVMIANVCGETTHIDNTIATLRFANRIMCVVASPIANVHYNPMGLVQKYENEIRALKEELAMQDLLNSKTSAKSANSLTERQIIDIKTNVKQYLTGNTSNIEFTNIREVKEIFNQFKEYLNSIEKEFQEKTHMLQESLARMEASSSTDTATVNSDETKVSQTTTGGGGTTSRSKGKFGIRKGTNQSSPTAIDNEEEMISNAKVEEGVTDGNTVSIGKASSINKTTGINKKRISFLPKMVVDVAASQKKKIGGGNVINGDMDYCTDDDKPAMRPSTPPSRLEAFEVFKKGRGREINKIFLQNKELLQQKRKAAYDISCQLNLLTQRIKEFRDMLKEKREPHLESYTTTDGRIVMDSLEYNILTNLQQAKEQYKTQFELLQRLQIDVTYCDQYTHESRQRMLQEFDMWYKLAFIGERPTSATTTTDDNPDQQQQQQQQQQQTSNSYFRDLQQAVLQQGHPSTTAFYYAQLRAHKRSLGQRRLQGIARRK